MILLLYCKYINNIADIVPILLSYAILLALTLKVISYFPLSTFYFSLSLCIFLYLPPSFSVFLHLSLSPYIFLLAVQFSNVLLSIKDLFHSFASGSAHMQSYIKSCDVYCEKTIRFYLVIIKITRKLEEAQNN